MGRYIIRLLKCCLRPSSLFIVAAQMAIVSPDYSFLLKHVFSADKRGLQEPFTLTLSWKTKMNMARWSKSRNTIGIKVFLVYILIALWLCFFSSSSFTEDKVKGQSSPNESREVLGN